MNVDWITPRRNAADQLYCTRSLASKDPTIPTIDVSKVDRESVNFGKNQGTRSISFLGCSCDCTPVGSLAGIVKLHSTPMA